MKCYSQYRWYIIAVEPSVLQARQSATLYRTDSESETRLSATAISGNYLRRTSSTDSQHTRHSRDAAWLCANLARLDTYDWQWHCVMRWCELLWRPSYIPFWGHFIGRVFGNKMHAIRSWKQHYCRCTAAYTSSLPFSSARLRDNEKTHQHPRCSDGCR